MAAKSHARDAAISRRDLAPSLAIVSPDVHVRRSETFERRSGLVETDGTDFSLRNATAADLDRLVCASIAGVVSKSFRDNHVRHRTRGAFSDLWNAPLPPDCLRRVFVADVADRRHGQLLLFQFADRRV